MTTHMMKKQLLFISLLFLTLFIGCTSDGDNTLSETAELTKGQEDFIELLKSKYPTQTVNFNTETALASSPYVKNQKLTLTFSSSGMLFIDTDPEKNDGDEIELPVFSIEGNEYIWKDTANDLSYALSLRTDNTINEVNVSQTSSSTFYASLKEYTDGIETKKTYSFLLLPNNIECTAQIKNKIETDQRLISMRTKFCDGSQKSLNFNFKADAAIGLGSYEIQATDKEERNPEAGKVALRLFIDGENYYGVSGTVNIKANTTVNTLIDCVFDALVLENSDEEQLTISGQILSI